MTRILILNAFKNAHLTDMSANIKTVRTTEKAEATRTRILDAALDLFRSQGFDQTTMREIAAEAGVALGSAYYYFESKDALVMAFSLKLAGIPLLRPHRRKVVELAPAAKGDASDV